MDSKLTFENLLLIAVADETLVVRFAPNLQPKYIPTYQSCRADRKAIIEMPGGVSTTVDHSVESAEANEILESVATEDGLYLFSHEYGHHLTRNPGYDDALKRCLTLPVNDRDKSDVDLIMKEETEAWEFGFTQLELLGHKIPERARALALQHIEGYRFGLTSADPANTNGAASQPCCSNKVLSTRKVLPRGFLRKPRRKAPAKPTRS